MKSAAAKTKRATRPQAASSSTSTSKRSSSKTLNVSQATHLEAVPDMLLNALMQAAIPTTMPSQRALSVKENTLAKANYRAEIVVKRAVHAGAAAWRPIADKIDMQVLFDNGTTSARLVRFAPGGISIGHTHRYDEGALIVEGACAIGKYDLTAGDYHLVPAGQSHGDIVSPRGCVLFVHGPSLKNRQHNDAR
jgi:quercetin dioxygenase-like cupin family protein